MAHMSEWASAHPAYAVFHPGQLKIEDFETYFFDILTTQYDHPRYVKHVLGRIYVFFPFGCGGGGGGAPGGSTKGLVHNLLIQFFTLGSSKIKIYFFDTMIT